MFSRFKWLIPVAGLFFHTVVFSQSNSEAEKKSDVVYNAIGITSIPANGPLSLELVARFQHRDHRPVHPLDKFDTSINSPKSVNYLPSKKKFYVQSLEGFETAVYDMETFSKLKVIKHTFNKENQHLFKDGESTTFDYTFRFRKTDFNFFSGKPVESCFSHEGRYLWVTYYRRSYDKNSESPSAVAIIDTDSDEILRVIPTGILPKMIACSPDNRFIAVTHWGDNTMGIIDIKSENVMDWKYTHHLVVDKRLNVMFKAGEDVNRDEDCGYCLRGTVFTPDSEYLLVGRMGGGGVAVFDVKNDFKYLGVTFTQYHNIRHLIISGDHLIISTNVNGYVQKTDWREFVRHRVQNAGKTTTLSEGWSNCYVGPGVRTVVASSDGRYIFACVNNLSKIVAIDESMNKVAEISADSFPVGMEITDDNQYLLVTAQGKARKGGGHSVAIYRITYANP